jgi:hypothetical protein
MKFGELIDLVNCYQAFDRMRQTREKELQILFFEKEEDKLPIKEEIALLVRTISELREKEIG